MTAAVQHQLIVLWFALYGLAVIGLVVSSLLGNKGYSFCRDRQTLIFRRQRLVRYSFGFTALLIAFLPTLVLRSLTLGIWPHFWCCLFVLGISFLAGPMDVKLFIENTAYESVVGFPLFPVVKRGKFRDFAGIELVKGRSGFLTVVRVTSPKERLLILVSFDKRDKAIAFVRRLYRNGDTGLNPRAL